MQQVFSRRQWVQYGVLVSVWVGVNAWFWTWWLQPQHMGWPVFFWIMSWCFAYSACVLPSMYLFYLGQMKRPIRPRVSPEAAGVKRVAVISLTVPGSEGIEIVERQLKAMAKIRYPHDSWILVDKEHSPEIEALAKKHGVRYFCRHDVKTWGAQRIAGWNQPKPPFQAKTKAGNVNAWIDAFGELYTHFTQLDIDHIPVPAYLDEVLPFFADKQVAWVQAPSVYGNFEHWTARGSSEQELVLQGPLQMGFYGFARTPFIIGSHCTYDMRAIQAIGGFQPTRAEDHLDTVCLAAQGKKGVFWPEVIAVGDGPENFEMYLKQQFAWAYSMIQVLFNWTPKLVKNYSFKQGIQFLFVQTWYPLWAISMLVLFVLPAVALVINVPISHTTFLGFLLRSLPMDMTALAVWKWSRQWQRPVGVGISWRGIVLHIARWIVVFQALIQVIFKVKKPYMITVKGVKDTDTKPFARGTISPYLYLTVVMYAACWWYLLRYNSGEVQGYLWFALQGAAIALIICGVAVMMDLSSVATALGWKKATWHRKAPVFVVALFITAWGTTLGASAQRISQALFTPIAPVGMAARTPTPLPQTGDSEQKEVSDYEGSWYVVQKGDSLWSIAVKVYGMGTYSRVIMENNQLKQTQVRPGQVLWLSKIEK